MIYSNYDTQIELMAKDKTIVASPKKSKFL